jgi:hypothetical protein
MLEFREALYSLAFLDDIAFMNNQSLVANDIYPCDTNKKLKICHIVFNSSHLFWLIRKKKRVRREIRALFSDPPFVLDHFLGWCYGR